MYFETNQVNNILICNQCEGRLDIPKILPCGKTICSFCAPLNLLSSIDNKFDCLVCKNKHEVPKDGLPNNEALLKMLSVKRIRVSRGKAFDLLEKSLDDIQKKYDYIKRGIENSTDFVNEYCMDLRSDVQLKTEEAIQQINDISIKIIEEINAYEKELIEYNKSNFESLDKFNNIVEELKLFHSVNAEFLKQHTIDDEQVNKLNLEATNLIEKTELEIKILKIAIFNEKFFKFEKNKKILNKSIFGETKIEAMGSFLTIDQMKILLTLCEFPVDHKLNLIYRASQDGFAASSFHSKCNDQPNTLILIKSINGNVFGGYTEQSWSGKGYKSDPNSFVFSLINTKNKPLKIKLSNNFSIYCCQNYGPVFGGNFRSMNSRQIAQYNYVYSEYAGRGKNKIKNNEYNESIEVRSDEELDFMITDQSNTNATSCSNLGLSYIHPNFKYGSDEAKSFLAGSHNFIVSEIEVYTK